MKNYRCKITKLDIQFQTLSKERQYGHDRYERPGKKLVKMQEMRQQQHQQQQQFTDE